MIVKNEELVLERCLNSVKNLVDEIIIVDTGSIDNTKDIAKRFTKNVLDYEWVHDFSKARNFAFSKATSKYILWLDADDIVPQKTIKELIKIKNNLSFFKINFITIILRQMTSAHIVLINADFILYSSMLFPPFYQHMIA